MSKEVIYIFIGGGTGSALRYFIQLLMHERIVPYHFPWATFTVNLLGSFLIGLFGMALFVNYMGFGDSILAGSLTLGLLCVPLVDRKSTRLNSSHRT